MHKRLLPLLAMLLVVLLLPVAAQAKAKPSPQYYVSIGDSYAAGYQPGSGYAGHGFAYQVGGFAKARGYRLTLVNFGCGGATTTSLLKAKGCPVSSQGPRSQHYRTQTQLEAAERFIRAHRANVKLITVSISGNDVTKCAQVPIAQVGACVTDALTGVNANLSQTVKRLRKAAGRATKIVGLTYPDVILGGWVRPGGRTLAEPSVTVFKTLLNPALKKQYRSVGASFVDVTTATGAYIPLTRTTTLAPYGRIPVAVAKVCTLTWYCARGDIHARTSGYRLIAQLVAAELPRRR